MTTDVMVFVLVIAVIMYGLLHFNNNKEVNELKRKLSMLELRQRNLVADMAKYKRW